MPGKNNVSTYRPRIFDSTLPHKSQLSSGYSFTSSLSFKSDESKDNTLIDFKERWSHLSPELQRPESAGLKMDEWRKRSADRLRSNDTWAVSWSHISSRYSFTSGLSFKSDESKENTLIDFKERWSHLSPEQQRPESAGRRRKRSTDSHGLPAKHSLPKKRLKESMGPIPDFIECSNRRSTTNSEDSSTSGLSCKSDRSKENIIYFKEGSSTLMSDYSPSSVEEEGAADDDDDVISPFDPAGSPSRISSRYSSTSSLSCKSDGSKDNTIIDFKEGSSSLMSDYSPSSVEEEGAADDDDDVISPFDPTGSPSPTSSENSSTSSLSFKSDGSKDNTIIDFKKGRSSLMEKDKRSLETS